MKRTFFLSQSSVKWVSLSLCGLIISCSDEKPQLIKQIIEPPKKETSAPPDGQTSEIYSSTYHVTGDVNAATQGTILIEKIDGSIPTQVVASPTSAPSPTESFVSLITGLVSDSTPTPVVSVVPQSVISAVVTPENPTPVATIISTTIPVFSVTPAPTVIPVLPTPSANKLYDWVQINSKTDATSIKCIHMPYWTVGNQGQIKPYEMYMSPTCLTLNDKKPLGTDGIDNQLFALKEDGLIYIHALKPGNSNAKYVMCLEIDSGIAINGKKIIANACDSSKKEQKFWYDQSTKRIISKITWTGDGQNSADYCLGFSSLSPNSLELWQCGRENQTFNLSPSMLKEVLPSSN